VPVVLNEELTRGLRELSARQGTTLYMTLLAAWTVLLARLSGQPDVVVGTPVANRGRVEVENLIGFFVNMVAVRVDVGGRVTVGELLQRVKGQALAAQQHQDIPFEQVVELLQPVRSLAHSPLFQVVFGWQDAVKHRPEIPGLQITPLHSSHVVSKFDLTLALEESGERIEGGVEYATALFERATVERYLDYFTRLLEGMVAADEQMVNDLLVLGEDEQRRLEYGRKANPKPAEYAERGYEAPLGEIETALAAIWRDLMGVDQVGRHDNFFELGGHSLLVTQLVLRIYQHFGVKIGISEVFEYAELSSLGAQVRQAQFAEFDSEEFANLMRDS
jgi:non-ribosomal peptide synthetase component F